MNTERTVALVGRPNVGKSRLFNRLAGRRIAIVHDQPGVTRDVNTVDVDGDYTLLDTGGIGLDAKDQALVIARDSTQTEALIDAAEQQVFVAIEAAKLILFVVDGRAGMTPLDEMIADRLRRQNKPVILIANKIDDPSHEPDAAELGRLGFGNPLLVSAEHGIGEDAMRRGIAEVLGEKPIDWEVPDAEERRVRMCFVGRPNVGKSSLCNRLLNDERLVVSEVPGTTRDSVELDLDFQTPTGAAWRFRLVDTAGMRKRTRLSSSVEYFSIKRTEDAIAGSDVAFLVLDAKTGVTHQDKTLAGQVLEAGRALAIIVNKWDFAVETFAGEGLTGFEDEADFRKQFLHALKKELFFLPDSPVIFASAKTGFSMDRILKAARRIDQNLERRLATGKLNRVLRETMDRQSPRLSGGKRFKLFYAVQVGSRPLRIRLFCNQSARLEESYKRYLEKAVQKEFELAGCPIWFSLVGKEKRYLEGASHG